MNTIFNAEQNLYLALLDLSKKYPLANDWLTQLPKWLLHIKDKSRYANATYYEQAVIRLPNVADKNVSYDFNAPNVTINLALTDSEYKQANALLKTLMPWRKGGFKIGDDNNSIHIDTEWRSDLKWDRVLPYIGDLKNKRVLDVGGGSGYHGFRMLGAGAAMVVVIDPSCLFYYQFMAIKHFLTNAVLTTPPIHFIPVALEQLPFTTEHNKQLFHTVFCMGVLYHRVSPFDCLLQLKNQLVKHGELILETLIVDGDENTVLVPKDRYAQMNNVYFLPSVKALTVWLEKAGFCDIRCVDINETSFKEQRATEWMDYQSLTDFLDPNDNTKTIEGYPRPKRAVMVAKKA
ncbi:tRNA mo(5)U34 methyltransferase [Moraxella macacae 0408225]|uniref:tRNA U34 carboxymethyltransferase n=1 Tax=Moraxella macacae 0408225 TaxID=1230338 RepID=L2F9T5_9GAMM|nr:tRNA 5-methoxyuridine(34)/uridine 5-oxyacetic acid(34) synthase CmoB [Moraxella macacae]ELA09233.1 tRNA mo(5)U34 methyltransferase [Moraxella macacae 0408225]